MDNMQFVMADRVMILASFEGDVLTREILEKLIEGIIETNVQYLELSFSQHSTVITPLIDIDKVLEFFEACQDRIRSEREFEIEAINNGFDCAASYAEHLRELEG